ncbi:MAG: glycosyltransferase family 2 protein [Leadbetterella sp.]|nr:glycosyltransferase family 2 protein [Leadbetterella sp.]
MIFLSNTAVILYGIAAFLVLLYTISQFFLFYSYLIQKPKKTEVIFEKLPSVTIQLPIFNEKYVVARLLNCIEKIDYPFLHVQVLDDSTDECLEISTDLVERLKSKGFDIDLIHRKDRSNFKAGALKNGLESSKGEFIAIFDADFLPEPDWIMKTIHHFTNPEVGVVQTRWKHINRNYGILTKVLGMALDHHFTIEQVGRNQSRHFINFNGTAGIWRKECILDAGNWQGDTLTEDLDLSYRAQMKNWEFVYLEDVETPSELPVVMSAIRSQQFRWNKGGAENFRKFGWKVLKSKTIGLSHKVQGFAHLLNSSVFVWVFLMSILSVPLVLIQETRFDSILIFGTALKYTVIILFFVFYTSFRKAQSPNLKDFQKFLLQFLVFFPVILGLTFHNSMAVLEGYFGIKSDFIRTPKFNIISNKDTWKNNHYLGKKLTLSLFIEILLIAFFSFGIFLAFKNQKYDYVPFHALLVLGYSIVVIKSFDE